MNFGGAGEYRAASGAPPVRIEEFYMTSVSPAV